MAEVTQKGAKIKAILDDELTFEQFSQYQDPDEEATRLFKKIFVEVLGFNEAPGIPGDEIPVNDWRNEAEVEGAYTIAEKGNVRVVYVISNKMSRTSQRYAVTSLTKEGWAQKGNFIAIFHSNNNPEEWHLVSPYVTEGRTILQRYVAGLGENHRTLSENLALMDVSLPKPLHERVLDAFRVKEVTEEFYEDYKKMFRQLKDHLSTKLQPKQSKQYAHLLLNRLMFLYFLQKKGWLANKKNFMSWFLKQYKLTGQQDEFHSVWLNTLFFKAMSKPSGEKELPADLPDEVADSLERFPFFNGGLFEKDDVDDTEISIPDEIILDAIEEFLDRYNFTIKEESAFDVDVAVDPAMLGKIYESLIAEEERGKAGIFYTPRVEVDLMCRFGLFQYLATPEAGSEDNSTSNESTTAQNKIIDFLFTPLEDWEVDAHPELRSLKEALDSVTVCDPACGSGAFLVGMLQALMDLYRKIGIEPDYELKERIIYRTIHGADIKDWAIRMAEFRLWLALIEGEPEIPQRSGEAILPNFNFNLKRGDSIVQKVGDEYIRLDLSSKHVIAEIQDELDELKKLHRRFYFGEKELKETIYDKQINILQTYIDTKIASIKKTRSTVQQKDLRGEVSEDSQKKHSEMTAQIEELEQQKQQLAKASSDRTFIWGLDFLEPMSEGGFDIVIANPPYVRQEEITDPKYDPEEIAEMTSDKRKKIKKQYKASLQEYAKQIWHDDIGKSADIYVHFFLKGLEITKSEGALVYISSNSWLDVRFGRHLQSALLRYAKANNILNSSAQRSFQEADVNTVITIAQKQNTPERLGSQVSFTNFRRSFEAISVPEVMKKVVSRPHSETVHYQGHNLYIDSTDSYRMVTVNENSLWQLGEGELRNLGHGEYLASGTYEGEKWGGRFLRAPDVFYTVLEKGRGKLVKLSDLANVLFGIKTGANEFYYLKPVNASIAQIVEMAEETPRTLVNVKNKAGWEGSIEACFLKPVMRSPRELETIAVRPEDLNQLIFVCNSSKNDLKKGGFDAALSYIEWGESAKYVCRRSGCDYRGIESSCPNHGNQYIIEDAFPSRSTCASRIRWWDLGNHDEPLAVWFKSFNDRFLVPSNEIHALSSDRFYEIHPKDSSNFDLKLIVLVINSTLLSMMAELTGRVNLGEGALDNMTYEAAENLMIDPNSLSAEQKKDIKSVYEDIARRETKNVFEELGLPKPNEDLSNINPEHVQLASIMPDRRKLDKAVFNAIGLTENEQLKVYKAVVEMAKNRLTKAQSV